MTCSNIILVELLTHNADQLTLLSKTLSIISVGIAGLALIVSFVAQKKASDAQRRILEIEEQRENDRIAKAKKASLNAKILKDPYRLLISNSGLSEARNIRMEFDEIPFDEHCSFLRNTRIPDFIGPNSEVKCPLGIHGKCGPPFEFKAIWDDDFSEARVYRTTLTW